MRLAAEDIEYFKIREFIEDMVARTTSDLLKKSSSEFLKIC